MSYCQTPIDNDDFASDTSYNMDLEKIPTKRILGPYLIYLYAQVGSILERFEETIIQVTDERTHRSRKLHAHSMRFMPWSIPSNLYLHPL